ALPSALTSKYPEPPSEGASIGMSVIECAPAARTKLPMLMPAVAIHTTGSSSQLALALGSDVKPRLTPKSKSWNRSPDRNASVTASVAPPAGATNVHGGAERNSVGVPLLGMQNPPAGSAGSHPAAGVPAVPNPNWYQTLKRIGPATTTGAKANSAIATTHRSVIAKTRRNAMMTPLNGIGTMAQSL